MAFFDDHIVAHRCRSVGAVHPINFSGAPVGERALLCRAAPSALCAGSSGRGALRPGLRTENETVHPSAYPIEGADMFLRPRSGAMPVHARQRRAPASRCPQSFRAADTPGQVAAA